MAEVSSLPLAAWSRWNAVVMSCAALAAGVVSQPWPVPALALPSFVVLIGVCRRAWTPHGGFGTANAVTALRLLLVAGAGVALHRAPGVLYCALVMLVFALDGIDGWLARRAGTQSAFGSHFDMETDAVFVLLLGLELWQRERLGAWVLVPGVLRYAYVICLAVVPARRGDMPRFTLGRRAFVAIICGYAFAFLVPGLVGTAAAALGAGLVTLSFGISFWWSYASKVPPASA